MSYSMELEIFIIPASSIIGDIFVLNCLLHRP